MKIPAGWLAAVILLVLAAGLSVVFTFTSVTWGERWHYVSATIFLVATAATTYSRQKDIAKHKGALRAAETLLGIQDGQKKQAERDPTGDRDPTDMGSGDPTGDSGQGGEPPPRDAGDGTEGAGPSPEVVNS